jgi:hypothetical protein
MLSRVSATWALVLIYCWSAGIALRILFWWGDLGKMIAPINTPSAVADCAWKILVLSAIFTLILAAFVRLLKPKRFATVVLIGGLLPHLLLNGVAALVIGR